mmetsp:Transcript_2418/g.6490  ORF Transcript_2418/g.6490 Transcript_2418/m.6490 type:complete len:480 (+) Transcript_2418:811-2250(+)
MVLGERTHDLRVFGDKGGMDDVVLQKLPDQGIEKPGRGVGGGALQVVFGQERQELGLDLGIVHGRQGRLHLLFQSLDHADALEGGGEIDLDLVHARFGRVLDLVAPADFLDESRDEFLAHVHQVVVIGIGLVELEGGEFGIVGQIDALVAELPADFVDPVQASYHQHLEVQFGRHAQVQVHAEVVVVGDEGFRGRPSRDHVHHGGFHLQKVSVVEVLADLGDDAGSDLENVADLVVDNQIEVALAVSGFHVGNPTEARVSLGKWDHVEAGTEEDHCLGKDRELSVLGLSGMPGDPDNVSSLEHPVDFRKGLLVLVGLGITHDLDLCSVSVEIVKEQFSLVTHRNDASRNGNRLVFNLFSGRRLRFVVGIEIGNPVVDVKLVRVGIQSVLFHLRHGVPAVLQELAGIGDLLLLFLLGGGWLRSGLGSLGGFLFRLFLGGGLGLHSLLVGVLGAGISVLVDVGFGGGSGSGGHGSIFGRHG